MKTIFAAILCFFAAHCWAGPPSYLLLMRADSKPCAPGVSGQPIYKPARGYAYGYFGAEPGVHWSRGHGIHSQSTTWTRN